MLDLHSLRRTLLTDRSGTSVNDTERPFTSTRSASLCPESKGNGIATTNFEPRVSTAIVRIRRGSDPGAPGNSTKTVVSGSKCIFISNFSKLAQPLGGALSLAPLLEPRQLERWSHINTVHFIPLCSPGPLPGSCDIIILNMAVHISH